MHSQGGFPLFHTERLYYEVTLHLYDTEGEASTTVTALETLPEWKDE